MKNPFVKILAPSLLFLMSGSPLASAAVLSVSPTTATAQADNLTFDIAAAGGLDWALWKKVTADTNKEVPTNSKLNGTAISDLSAFGGAGINTSGNSVPNWDFSYSGGTSPASGTLTDVNGVFNSTLSTKGVGLSFTVTLPTTDLYQISIWTAGYGMSGLLTASMPGASDSTGSFTADTGGIKDMFLFTINAQADVAGQAVTVSVVNNSTTGATASSHVIISAIAVQQIPEPSALALCSLGVFGLLRRRR